MDSILTALKHGSPYPQELLKQLIVHKKENMKKKLYLRNLNNKIRYEKIIYVQYAFFVCFHSDAECAVC